MRLPRLSATVLRAAVIPPVTEGQERQAGIYPLDCRTCCGSCTGASFWRRSCAPDCYSPRGYLARGYCGARSPFYRACTRVCDGPYPYTTIYPYHEWCF